MVLFLRCRTKEIHTLSIHQSQWLYLVLSVRAPSPFPPDTWDTYIQQVCHQIRMYEGFLERSVSCLWSTICLMLGFHGRNHSSAFDRKRRLHVSSFRSCIPGRRHLTFDNSRRAKGLRLSNICLRDHTGYHLC